MPSNLKVIYFDVDDTLYDHSYHIHSGISALRETYPFLKEYSLEFIIELSHRLLEETHLRLLKGEISLSDARRIRWRKFLEVFHMDDKYDPHEFSSHYVQAYYAAERTVPGAIELLEALKKDFSIGIISNNLLDEQLGKIRRIGISEYIDFFAISEEVGIAKPDRRIFEVALKRGNVKADEAVYIGDSWNIDILGSLNAGIYPIWLNRNGLQSPDPNVAEISSFLPLDDVLSYIRRESVTPQITSPDPAKA